MESGGDLAGGIARRDIRLYRFAPPHKARPVVVLTRDSALRYLSTATVAPITTRIRGVPSEVRLDQEDGLKTPCAVNLHNAVTVSQRRLGRRVAQLAPRKLMKFAERSAFPWAATQNNRLAELPPRRFAARWPCLKR